MSDFKEFISGFVKRDGLAVLLSTFLIKISGILIAIVVVRLLPIKQYGDIALAVYVINILTVFGGIGTNWSLLRFGPTLPSVSAKYQLFKFSVNKGFLYSLPIILLIVTGAMLLPANLRDSRYYLIILSLGIITSFLYQSLESYFRIIGKNKIYSKSNVIGSLTLLVLAIVLSHFFEGYGYVSAIVLAPLMSYLYFRRHVSFRRLDKTTNPGKTFFTYGLYTSLGMIASQATISLGPIIGGFLSATSNDMAMFRVATIIPFNLLVFPLMIMTTDFVHFSKNSRNPGVLRSYYFQYLKTIGSIAIIPFVILLVFNKYVLVILFGQQYAGSADMSFVLLLGVLCSFLFRIPLGNILAAAGKADWNVIHTVFWLVAFVPMSIYSFLSWGMLGIAISISSVFILSGFVSLFLFFFYLKMISQGRVAVNL